MTTTISDCGRFCTSSDGVVTKRYSESNPINPRGLYAAYLALQKMIVFRVFESGKPRMLEAKNLDQVKDILHKTRGSDLYFVRNALTYPFKAPKSCGRDEDVFAWRSIWLDFDAKHAIPATWFCSPTFIIQTSPGNIHVHWLFKSLEEDIGRCQRLQTAIQQHYGSDALNDHARIIRAPGSLHTKTGTLSLVLNTLEANPDARV
jgi:RepB DNA-primase from phage plasmid